MLKSRLFMLLFVTIIVIVTATILVKLRAPQSGQNKIAFFPDLANKIESITHIRIEGYGQEINLTRINNHWGIDEFDHYAALPDKVKGVVLGAVDLKINAAKTALPRLYHRLGVEGPTVADTTSLLVTLTDNAGNHIIEVIVGKPRHSRAAQNSPGLYVRRLNDARSYLVDGAMPITANKVDWIERSLFDIPAEQIQSVRIDHHDGDTFTLYKREQGQEKFEFEALPDGKKLASALIVNRFGSLLQDVQISGAKTKIAMPQPGSSILAKIVTFDGITAQVIAFEIDGIAYAGFEFSDDENTVFEEAEKGKALKDFVDYLNMRVSGWWFEIPAFKYDILKKRADSVLRDDTEAQTE